eukprot:gene4075-5821_t
MRVNKVHSSSLDFNDIKSKSNDGNNRSPRNATNDIKDHADSYDICLVFPAVKSEEGHWELSSKCHGYMNKIMILGFDYFAYAGNKNGDSDDNTIVVLLKAKTDSLRAFADRIDFKMLLDEDELKKKLELSVKVTRIEVDK